MGIFYGDFLWRFSNVLCQPSPVIVMGFSYEDFLWGFVMRISNGDFFYGFEL